MDSTGRQERIGPYVSFVTWVRNDGYTDDYARRVNRATLCLARQLDRARIESEIILTEWNPLADRPLLLEVINLPAAMEHVTVRGIVVPPEFHRRFAGAHEGGLHGSEAANVGVRRARGSFITPKASDTFFSPQAIDMIAWKNLDPDTMYRMDRQDIAIDDSAIWDLDDGELLARLEALPSIRHTCIQQVPYWRLHDLHTNACGDFTLMGAAYYHLLRGYPRDESILSLDADSLMMHAAAAHGVRECRWPAPCTIYKPLHGNLNSVRITPSWTAWQHAWDRFLRTKVSLEAAHWFRTHLDYPRRKVRGFSSVLGASVENNFVKPASRWARGSYPIPTQPQNWGLADKALEERILCRAAWDTASSPVSA